MPQPHLLPAGQGRTRALTCSPPSFPLPIFPLDPNPSSLPRRCGAAGVRRRIAVSPSRPGRIGARQLLPRVFLYLPSSTELAGRLGIEQIVLARVRSLRRSPRSAPAKSGRLEASQHRRSLRLAVPPHPVPGIGAEHPEAVACVLNLPAVGRRNASPAMPPSGLLRPRRPRHHHQGKMHARLDLPPPPLLSPPAAAPPPPRTPPCSGRAPGLGRP